MGVAPPTQPYAPFYPVPGVAQSPTGPMSAFAATTPPTMAVPGLEPLPVMPVPGPGATPEEMAHYQRLQLAELGPGAAFTPGTHNLGLLLDVPVPITVVAGRAVMRIQEVLGLQHGSVVPLDRNVEEPVDLLIKDKLIAQGELVVIDEKFFGIKITKIVEPEQRVKDLG
jgi:flagellar motor switch protein FliN/FliY